MKMVVFLFLNWPNGRGILQHHKLKVKKFIQLQHHSAILALSFQHHEGRSNRLK
jgi:hypothetical protein